MEMEKVRDDPYYCSIEKNECIQFHMRYIVFMTALGINTEEMWRANYKLYEDMVLVLRKPISYAAPMSSSHLNLDYFPFI